MFSDEENNPLEEEEALPEAEDDSPETMMMAPQEEAGGTAEAKEKADEWVTAKVPSAPAKPKVKAAAKPADDEWVAAGSATPAPAASAAQKAEPVKDAHPVQETPPAMGTPSPPVYSASPAPAQPASSEGGIWGLLAKIGISDRKTQQWVLIGGSVLIVACCACSCLVAILIVLSNQ
nr:hypothetical protein [Anaerolineae bacterium]